MAHKISAVLEYGAPEPGETATIMEDKLRFYTDSWDLSVDLKGERPAADRGGLRRAADAGSSRGRGTAGPGGPAAATRDRPSGAAGASV